MSGESKTVGNLKGQLSLSAQAGKYSGIISKGFKKPKQNLIKEMVPAYADRYVIQASKDVKLSNCH